MLVHDGQVVSRASSFWMKVSSAETYISTSRARPSSLMANGWTQRSAALSWSPYNSGRRFLSQKKASDSSGPFVMGNSVAFSCSGSSSKPTCQQQVRRPLRLEPTACCGSRPHDGHEFRRHGRPDAEPKTSLIGCLPRKLLDRPRFRCFERLVPLACLGDVYGGSPQLCPPRGFGVVPSRGHGDHRGSSARHRVQDTRPSTERVSTGQQQDRQIVALTWGNANWARRTGMGQNGGDRSSCPPLGHRIKINHLGYPTSAGQRPHVMAARTAGWSMSMSAWSGRAPRASLVTVSAIRAAAYTVSARIC